MEPNENQFSSHFHPQYHGHQESPPTTATAASPTVTATTAASPTVMTTASLTNVIFPNTHQSSDGTTHMVYPHSVSSMVKSQLEPAKKKRGRTRKYFTPDQALAAKKAATASSHSSSSEDKKDYGYSSPSGSSKKSQLVCNEIELNGGCNTSNHITCLITLLYDNWVNKCRREIQREIWYAKANCWPVAAQLFERNTVVVGFDSTRLPPAKGAYSLASYQGDGPGCNTRFEEETSSELQCQQLNSKDKWWEIFSALFDTCQFI